MFSVSNLKMTLRQKNRRIGSLSQLSYLYDPRHWFHYRDVHLGVGILGSENGIEFRENNINTFLEFILILIQRTGKIMVITSHIDVGKFNHCCSVINSDGECLLDPFFFDNNHDGFDLLLHNIKQFRSSRHISDLESTGHYGDNLRNTSSKDLSNLSQLRLSVVVIDFLR